MNMMGEVFLYLPAFVQNFTQTGAKIFKHIVLVLNYTTTLLIYNFIYNRCVLLSTTLPGIAPPHPITHPYPALASFSVNSNWHSACFHYSVIKGQCAFPSVALHLPCFPSSPLQSSTCGSQSLGCASLTGELFTLYTTRPHSHHSGWVPLPMPWQRAGIFWHPGIHLLLFQSVLL